MTMGQWQSERLSEILSGPLNRRGLLKRAAALGFATPAVAGLLAACGGEDEGGATTTSGGATTTTGSGAATTTTGGGAATTTTGGGAASPTTGGGTTGGAASPAAGASPASGTGQKFNIEPAKNKGGRVIYGNFSDIKTLNPVLVNDVPSDNVSDMVFNSMVTVDPATFLPGPELAKSWEITPDGVTYTFTLRDGVTWHDGQPLTANDVKFTYDLHLNPASKSPRTSELKERIKSMEVKDDKTIVYTMTGPVAPFLVSNMIYNITPQHKLKDADPAALAQHPFSTGQKGTTIGTGPFIFEEWVQNDHVTLSKNAKYFEGEPNLDQFVYKVVPNQTVVVQQAKTGEITFADGLPEPNYEELKKVASLNVVTYDYLGFTFYTYQLDTAKSTLFQDKAVRQALLYALDRKAMIEAIRFGLGEVAIGTMPVPSWAYAPDKITNKYPYDQDKAKKLLDDAGWKAGSDGIRAKDGKRLSFTVYTNAGNQIREQYIQVLQQSWAKIGVDCKPQTEEFQALVARLTGTHDFEMILLGFSWDVDPDQSTMWSTGGYEGGFNSNKYSNPEVDRILKEALAATDQNKRKDLYIQMQNILMEDLPTAILDFQKRIATVNKKVHNLFPNTVDHFFNAHQWWVEP